MADIDAEPAAPTPAGSQVDEQLRLAIAMRGGVSLAVWIGGALAEIDVLRRSIPKPGVTESSDPNARIYRALLRLAGYTSVQVDVLSGASAGGLNGAIYAASLMYDIDFRHMLPIWVRLADIESMIRIRTRDRTTKRPADSLLEGDEYFLARLAQELAALTAVGSAPELPVVSYLDLVLTGTLVDPADEIVVGAPGENMRVGRRAAFFQFHHEHDSRAITPSSSHFRTSSVSRRAIVDRLALAGRASASFPVAFEPATVTTDSGTTDMATIFSERGAPDTFRVMDGGVLDNIPIARAITAVAASPAAEPTDRWLLYLYPSPPDEPMPPPRPPGSPVRALSTVRRALGAKLGTETILDDTAALEHHNDEAQFQAIRWQALWHGAGAAEDGWVSWVAGLEDPAAVVSMRAEMDAARILEILDQPRRCFAGRPEVLDDPGTPLASLDPAVAAAVRGQLETVLRATYTADPSLATDAVTMRSAIDLLIGACRAVERWGGAPGATPKRALYALRAEAERAVIASELALIARLRSEPPKDAGETPAWLAREVGVVDAPPDIAAAVDQAHRQLEDLVATLRDLQEPPEPLLRPFRMLAHVGVEGLLAMARHATSMRATTLQNPSPLTLKVISGAAPTPLACAFETYDEQTERPAAGFDRVYVDDKLAGNALANFAAFLKADWRINDWTWGRADAASRLAEALIDRIDLEHPRDAEALADLYAALGEEVPSGVAAADERTRLHTAVVRRLQLDLWRHHLPLLDSAAERAEPDWDPSSAVLPPRPERSQPPAEPAVAALSDEDALDRLRTYAVGREDLSSIKRRDRRRIAMRLAKIGFATVLPARPSASPEPAGGTPERRDLRRRRRAAALGRWALWPLRPLVLGVVYIVAAPLRAAASIMLFTVAVAVGWWATDLSEWGWRRFLVPGIPAALLVVAALITLLVKRDGWKLAAVLLGAGALLVGLFVVVDVIPDEPEALRPGSIAVAAVVIAFLGTSWMRWRHRSLSTLFTAAVYVGMVWFFRWVLRPLPGPWWEMEEPFPVGWWTITCVVITAVLLGIQVSHYQVFPARPGRDS